MQCYKIYIVAISSLKSKKSKACVPQVIDCYRLLNDIASAVKLLLTSLIIATLIIFT